MFKLKEESEVKDKFFKGYTSPLSNKFFKIPKKQQVLIILSRH
jgi:hypothetical protein